MNTVPFLDSTDVVGSRDSLRGRADELGYLFLRRCLDPEPVLAVRRLALEVCAELGWLDPRRDVVDGIAREGLEAFGHEDPRFTEFQRRVLPLPEFHRLGQDPKILEVLEAVYGARPTPGGGDVCRLVFPASSAFTTRPHQDQFYVAVTERLWTVWIALGECPIELGPLAVVPQSHQGGLLAHITDGETQGVAVPEIQTWATGDIGTGDVLMFSGFTVHRACENRTPDRIRLSADYRYVAAQE